MYRRNRAEHRCIGFVQSVVDARRAGDENPLYGVAETIKLPENNYYGYRITDRSKHTMTNYLGDEKTHKLSTSF